jgi:hypothetical protein
MSCDNFVVKLLCVMNSATSLLYVKGLKITLTHKIKNYPLLYSISNEHLFYFRMIPLYKIINNYSTKKLQHSDIFETMF